MVAQVAISEEGAVTVVLDSDDYEDDERRNLAGLALDDMLERAAEAALATWRALRADDGTCSD
jgi:hypothetical protein